MAQRPGIPDKLEARVMLASDNTCCICHKPEHGTVIHHVDGNSGNNEFDNLAVLCPNCHDKAHARREAE